MTRKYLLFFISLSFFSCVRKIDCNIEPISLNVLDTTKLKGDFIFKNQKGDFDSLILLDCYNVLRTQTTQALSNYKECGHTIGYNYDSRNGSGTIGLSLKKNENEEYSFSVNGFCIRKDFSMNQQVVVKDSLFIIKVDSCENSKFKELAFRKFKLEYFITQNGDIWKSIKFIPRELKK